MIKLRGCGTAIVTPFLADGSLDEKALRSLVAWQIESGIDFLVPCGTTGETPTLTHAEWLPGHRNHHRSRRRTRPHRRRRHLLLHRRGRRQSLRSRQNQGCGRHPHRLALLQQAHPGGPVPALQGHRGGRRNPHHHLQHPRPHRRQCGARNPGPPGRHPQHHRRQRGQRKHHPDRAKSAACCPRPSPSSAATTRSPSPSSPSAARESSPSPPTPSPKRWPS